MSNPWVFLVVGALVTWRVSRFFQKDDLIARSRKRLLSWLDSPRPGHPWRDFWADKAWTLIICPWCFTIWVSAGYILLTRWLVEDAYRGAPVWMWLAIAGLSIIPYEYTDGE
jgi:hypothetical protein